MILCFIAAIIRAVVADKLGIELAAPEPTMETAPPPPSQGEPTSLPDSQQQEVSKVFGEQKLEAEAGEVKEDKASSDETKVAEGDETKVAEGETKVIEGDETKVAKGETKVIEGDKTKVVEGETKVAEGDETKVAGEEVPPASEDAGTVDTEVESIKANADGTPPAVKEPETESLQTDKHQEADKAEVSPDEPNKTDEEPSDSIKDSRETDTVDTKTEETDAESADQPNTSSEQS